MFYDMFARMNPVKSELRLSENTFLATHACLTLKNKDVKTALSLCKPEDKQIHYDAEDQAKLVFGIVVQGEDVSTSERRKEKNKKKAYRRRR